MSILLLICMLFVFTSNAAQLNPPVKLAYGIMVYQKKDTSIEEVMYCFRRVFDLIYSSHKHYYVIHLDIKSDERIFQQIHEICDSLSNCAMIAPRNVAWGGISTGEMMMALMQGADESNYDWDYFVLLGHESIPMTSIETAENVIASYPPKSNFINCWNTAEYNFFGQIEHNTYRIEGIVVDNYQGGLIESIRERRVAPSNIVFYKSIQQMVLSREFIKYVTFIYYVCIY